MARERFDDGWYPIGYKPNVEGAPRNMFNCRIENQFFKNEISLKGQPNLQIGELILHGQETDRYHRHVERSHQSWK